MKKFLLPVLLASLLSSCGESPELQRYPTIKLENLPSPAAGRSLTAVDFVSATQGYVGGDNGLLLMTTDAGQTWTTRTAPTAATINKLYFSSPTAGWAATANGLFRTSDGGQTWQRVTVYYYTTGNYRDLQFVTPQVGYLISNADIYRTTNGGTTWTSIKSYNWSAFLNLSSLAFSSADSGMVAGADNFEYKTTNGGLTWTTSNIVPISVPTAMIRRRNGSVVATGTGFYDIGASGSYSDTREAYPYSTAPLYALARWQDRIVAVGEKSVVKRLPGFVPADYNSTDWVRMQGPRAQALPGTYRSVDFADADTFYAVGDEGVITRFRY